MIQEEYNVLVKPLLAKILYNIQIFLIMLFSRDHTSS